VGGRPTNGKKRIGFVKGGDCLSSIDLSHKKEESKIPKRDNIRGCKTNSTRGKRKGDGQPGGHRRGEVYEKGGD